MLTNSFSTHLTATHRVSHEEGSGWEFVCSECGYHVRYWERTQPGLQYLEIVNPGNPEARHWSSSAFPQTDGREIEPLMDYMDPSTESEEESWLTPELRMQLENIVKAMDEDRPD